MCGLVGIVSKSMTAAEQKAFAQLLYMDTLRGYDATGVCAVNGRTGRPQIYKRAIQGSDFVYLRTANKLIDGTLNQPSLLMGHNRAATKGGVSDSTSHPFHWGDITLAHNGTLDAHRTLPGGSLFDVDSEAICNAFNEEGAAAVIPVLKGAFTLTWHDRENNTFNIVRNSERPMQVAELTDYNGNLKGIVYASEAWMIRAVSSRVLGFHVQEPVELPEGQWLSMSLDPDTFGAAVSEEVELAPVKKIWTNGTYITGGGKQTKKNKRRTGAKAPSTKGGQTTTGTTTQQDSTSKGGESKKRGSAASNRKPVLDDVADPQVGGLCGGGSRGG